MTTTTNKYVAKLNELKVEAKETYNTLVQSSATFDEYMDEEDKDWKDDLIDEMHRIRKALKNKVKIVDPQTKVATMVDRPNTVVYLNGIKKRLSRVSKDVDDLFKPYCDSDEETA